MKSLRKSLLLAVVAACASAQQLTLDEAVNMAIERVSERERARLTAVTANELYLEAQSKFRFELRPRVGLLAFSSPALLASNIGLGLLLGRTPPPAVARQNARLDSLAAEAALERAVVTTRLEVTRHYFQLLLRQKTRDELADAVRQYRAGENAIAERTQSARITALDRAAWETRLIHLELQLEEADSSLREAAALLAQTIGVGDTDNVLQVADLDGPEPDAEMPSAAAFYNIALNQRDHATGVRKKLEAEKKQLLADTGLGVTPLLINYAHLNDQAGSRLSTGQGGFLLGGHTGSIDLGVKLSLRRTGEEEALAYLAAARIRAIELELQSVSDFLRSEVESLRLLAISSRRKAEIAARRLKLSTEVSRLVSMREQTGLESAESLLNAGAELMRSRTQLRQSQFESRTRWLHLLAACELKDSVNTRNLLLGQASLPAPETQIEAAQ